MCVNESKTVSNYILSLGDYPYSSKKKSQIKKFPSCAQGTGNGKKLSPSSFDLQNLFHLTITHKPKMNLNIFLNPQCPVSKTIMSLRLMNIHCHISANSGIYA